MAPIDLVGRWAGRLSLEVRLFANMTAGHTILAVLFGMVVSIPLIPVAPAVKIALLVLVALMMASRHRVFAKAGLLGLVGAYFLIAVLVGVIWLRLHPLVFTIAING